MEDFNELDFNKTEMLQLIVDNYNRERGTVKQEILDHFQLKNTNKNRDRIGAMAKILKDEKKILTCSLICLEGGYGGRGYIPVIQNKY